MSQHFPNTVVAAAGRAHTRVIIGAVLIAAIVAWTVVTVARLPYDRGYYYSRTECYGCMAPPAHER